MARPGAGGDACATTQWAMLTHASAARARAYHHLVLASVERGVLDLHALVQLCRPATAPTAAEPWNLGWALAALSGDCFACEQLAFVAAPAAEADPATRLVVATLPQALAQVDAFVALAVARLGPPPLAPALSRRERALWHAARAAPWPQITFAPALRPSHALAAGEADGTPLADAIEAALAVYPADAAPAVHLWLGSLLPCRLLSPYLRQTSEALIAAAPARLAQLHGPRAWPALPDLPYALQAAVERAAPAVAAERRAFEAGCGMATVQLGGAQAQLLLSSALNVQFADARLHRSASPFISQAAPRLLVCVASVGPAAALDVAPGHWAVGTMRALVAARRPPARLAVLGAELHESDPAGAVGHAACAWQPLAEWPSPHGPLHADADAAAFFEAADAAHRPQLTYLRAHPAADCQPLWQAAQAFVENAPAHCSAKR